MSIDLGRESLEVNVVDRTWRIELFADYEKPYRMVAHREKLFLKEDGSVLNRELLPAITKTMEQIENKDFDGMSGFEVAQKIAAAVDLLRKEQIEAQG